MMVWWCFCGGGLWRWCFCGGVFVAVFLWWCFWSVCVVVFLWWWCFCGGVVVFLWWCFLGGVCVVMFLRWCFLWWCFCSVCVVVFLWWCGGVFVAVVCGGGVFVVVFLWRCFCGGVFEVFVWWCFCGGGVFVVVWWCFCGGVFLVVFVWWCFLWWCGGVFVVVGWCFCGGGGGGDLRPAYVELAAIFLFVWTYLTWMNCLTILACQHLACLDLAWLVLARRFPWLDLLGLTFFLNGATCLTWLGLFALSYLTLHLLFCRVYFFLRVYPHFKNDLWLGIVMWNAIIWGSQETPFAKTGW